MEWGKRHLTASSLPILMYLVLDVTPGSFKLWNTGGSGEGGPEKGS